MKTEKTKDGGPAFPLSKLLHNPETQKAEYSQRGMSLRDWFAGRTLSALILNGTDILNSQESIAKGCYKIADAMLKEREL